jgi:hypothetical protein
MRHRHPRGTPAGGQFATGWHDECDVLLADDDLIDPAPPFDWETAGVAADGRVGPVTTMAVASARDSVDELRRSLSDRPVDEGAVALASAAAEQAICRAGYAITAEVERRCERIERSGHERPAAYALAVEEVVGAIRPLGVPGGECLRVTQGHRVPVALVERASAHLPTDWLVSHQRSAKPLVVTTTRKRSGYSSAYQAWTEVRSEVFAGPGPHVIDEVYRAVVGVRLGGRPKPTPGTSTALLQVARISLMTTLDPNAAESHAVHELTHRMEDCNPHLGRLERAFLDRRCRDASGELAPLKSLRGTNPIEWVRPGGFANPYIGRWYADQRFTEVLSCGVEAVYHGAFHSLDGDPDHRAFVLGALAAA